MKDFEITDTLRISTDKGSYVIQTRKEFDESLVLGNGASGEMKLGKWKTRGWYSSLSSVLLALFDMMILESNAELATAIRNSFLEIGRIEEEIRRMASDMEKVLSPSS